MNEDHGKPGIRVDNKIKQDLVLCLRERIEREKIKIYKDFFTFTETPILKLSPQDIIDETFHQLMNYSRILKPSLNNVHAPPKEFYGGKLGHGHDDLAIAFQINAISHNRFYSSDNEEYKKIRAA